MRKSRSPKTRAMAWHNQDKISHDPSRRVKRLNTDHVANRKLTNRRFLKKRQTGLNTTGKRAKHKALTQARQGASPAQMQTPPEHVHANSSSPPELIIPLDAKQNAWIWNFQPFFSNWIGMHHFSPLLTMHDIKVKQENAKCMSKHIQATKLLK